MTTKFGGAAGPGGASGNFELEVEADSFLPASWVVGGGSPGETAHCTRCGEGLNLSLPQRVEVWVAATQAFAKCHAGCQPGHYHPVPIFTPAEWLIGRDTGISSITIWAAITGNRPQNLRDFDVPHDPADFGRCYRLLNLFTAWRKDLPKVAELCPKWKPFVEAWDELTVLYEEELPSGKCPKLYKRMQELRAIK